MAAVSVAVVEFCRWIVGGGRLHFFSSSSSSSKSKLTVLSAFLIFLVVVTASLFAISHLPSAPLLSPSPSFSSSYSSSSSTMLSWFFFSPSSSNSSLNPAPPTLLAQPPAPQEGKKEDDGVVVDPEVYGSGHGSANSSSSSSSSSLEKSPLSEKESEQGLSSPIPSSAKSPLSGKESEPEEGSRNTTSSSSFSSSSSAKSPLSGKESESGLSSPAPYSATSPLSGKESEPEEGSRNTTSSSSFSAKSPLSGKESEQGSRSTILSHTGNCTNNSTLVLATDRSNGGQNSTEALVGKSMASKSPPSNITIGCEGPQLGNVTIAGVCLKGQILERKNASSEQDHQSKEQQQEEKNQGGRGTANAAATMQKNNFSSSSAEMKAAGPPAQVKTKGADYAHCDIFDGRWVWDERNEPYYPPGSCPYIDGDFNCHNNGRPDSKFLKWRWQPYGCNIPRLNASDFLGRLRGRRLIFVGDSLSRNMWESLICILRNSIKNKNRVYEVSGRRQFKTKGRRRQFKTKGHYSFKFADYECSVEFVRSTFLVKEVLYKNENGFDDEKLRLDILDETTAAYREADVIVFNTGHWWTHEKTSRGINYYQEGNHVYPTLKVLEAYKRALITWARWIDTNIDSRKTQVFFRGYSLTHFRGGQWNSGGQCHKETDPIFNQTYLAKYPSKMRVLEYILKEMRTPVVYLNISRLTDYRKDGHPSIYRKKYSSIEEQIAAEKSQDCSHWCLPGIPDSWNELLYASLLIAGKGSWGR
ncbi:protein trichome birefringence-like 2 [Canna indica]|uniref:Protein trichome birefringence-like 2 n=1 Tax=Canna indica TaxID=4628 RepID=A0AAQ3L4Y9_9LILI|nr:protein trichome birefringence-like 2 [Canna indica]